MGLREFPLPEVGDDDGLMRVEMTGVCGVRLRLVPRKGEASALSGDSWPRKSWGGSRSSGRRPPNASDWRRAIAWWSNPASAAAVAGSARQGTMSFAITIWGTAPQCPAINLLTSGGRTVNFFTSRLAPGCIRSRSPYPAEAAVLTCGVLANGLRWAHQRGRRRDRRYRYHRRGGTTGSGRHRGL